MSEDAGRLMAEDGANGPEGVLEALWRTALEGVRNARHGWHLGALATTDPEGGVDVRTLVLRDADPGERTFAFHTDARSEKLSHLQADDRVGVLLYDRDLKLQLRARGRATIHRTDRFADAAWAGSSPSSRRCYLAPHAPSATLEAPVPNLPEAWRDRVPDLESSELGRPNFALIRCRLDSIDWLNLHHDGHQRIRFRWDPEGVLTTSWLAP